MNRLEPVLRLLALVFAVIAVAAFCVCLVTVPWWLTLMVWFPVSVTVAVCAVVGLYRT